MADDESAIIESHEEFAAAWSRGDVDAVMALFAEGAVRVGVAGDAQEGRGEIRSAMERVLTSVFRGATLEIERGTVRFLGPDVAIWRGNILIRPAGAPAPLRGHSVDVMKRVGDRWLILETHPKVFPPPTKPAEAAPAGGGSPRGP
jgi:uncharacterized protein (TIGR02246 family)